MSHVYLMGSKRLKFFKIGVSKNPRRRLQSLNVPFELELLAAYRAANVDEALLIEAALHRRYRRQRVAANGHREWFHKLDWTEVMEALGELIAERQTDETDAMMSTPEHAAFTAYCRRILSHRPALNALSLVLSKG